MLVFPDLFQVLVGTQESGFKSLKFARTLMARTKQKGEKVTYLARRRGTCSMDGIDGGEKERFWRGERKTN